MKNFAPMLRLRALAASIAAWNARGRSFELDEVINPRSKRGVNPMPVASDGGFTNVRRSHIMGPFIGVPYDPMWHKFMNDFDVYSAADWAITDTGAGASALLADYVGGGLKVSNDDGVINHLRMHQLAQAGFLLTQGKVTAFSAKFQVDASVAAIFAVGLQALSANPFLPPADGVWFSDTSAAAASIDFNVSSTLAGLATSLAVAAAVDATDIELDFVYDGEGSIWYGKNGAVLGKVSDANVPLAVKLAPFFAVKNGTGVARSMTLDWLFVAQQR